MLKRHTFWLKAAIVLMIITGLVHSISLFVEPIPQNETEKLMVDLMATYKMDLGAGFTPTMAELITALSSCFTWLYLFGAFILIFLIRKKASNDILKGITGVHVIFFGISFLVMLFFTFMPPIVLTALCFLFLTLAYFLFPKTA